MDEKLVQIIFLDIFILVLLFVFSYIIYFKNRNEIKEKQINFFDYIESKKDYDTINKLKNSHFMSKKIVILINKYSETDDAKYLIYAIEYFFRTRNITYILFLLAVLLLINLYFFVK